MESKQRERGSWADLHHVALGCIIDSSSSFLSTVSCPLSLPISLRPACYVMVVTGVRLADANSSGWQMPGVSADALHQPMTDVRAPFGRQHFITLHCSPSSPHWTNQPAWQTSAQSQCTSPIHSFATPFHPHIYTRLCIHQSSVITSDSSHTGNQWITC